MSDQSIHSASASAQNGFPTASFLRDFRAAGGSVGTHDDRVFLIFGDETADADTVHRSYCNAMRADPEHRQKICAALEDEVANLPAAELARLHAY